MRKLYLDIDGVLLTAKHTQAAPGVDEFVEFITQNFACYWLTTHCKGDSAPALRYLSRFLTPATLEKLRIAVQPTNWDTLKTEAIDLASDFYWLDDSPFQAEIAYLQTHNVANRLLVVDLNRLNELATILQHMSLIDKLGMLAKEYSKLAKAIEYLYEVFGKYPLSTLEGCPCCVTPDDKCQLTKKDLRSLSASDLGRYCGKAMTTWGSVNDFKHFLPRIFELVADYQAPYDEFIIFNKLTYGEWAHWPEIETQALLTYFQELWEFVLQGEEAYFHDYFVALAFIYPHFEELLARWQLFTSTTSIELLASEIFRNNEYLFNNKYFHGAFFTSPEYSKLFRQWVRTPIVKEALLQAIEFCQDERTLTEISVAYELIEIDTKLNQVL